MITSSALKEREEINIHVTLEATSDIVDSVASMHDMGIQCMIWAMQRLAKLTRTEVPHSLKNGDV